MVIPRERVDFPSGYIDQFLYLLTLGYPKHPCTQYEYSRGIAVGHIRRYPHCRIRVQRGPLCMGYLCQKLMEAPWLSLRQVTMSSIQDTNYV